MWDQLKALIGNGVRVFHFAWPWKWRKLREKYVKELRKRFGREKTDFGDAYILSRIRDEVPKAFREITPLDAVFKPLLIKEKALARELMRLQQMLELGIDVEDEIRNCEERLRNVRGEIVENAMEKIPRFADIAGELGLSNNDVNGLSALAGLLIHFKWPYWTPSFHKARRFLGLYKPTREDKRKYEERSGEKYRKRYSGCARRCLNLMTAAILIKKKGILRPRARDEKEVLRRLLGILKTHNNETIAGGGAG
ncbi:MAG: hypothetical protein QXI18_04035 [Nitrososphaerota archaeon]